jgi:bleomycin hydrolase
MKTLVVQNQFLEGVADLLEDGQSVRIRIGGSSMDPFIRGGVDEVELVPYVPGDELPLWTGVFFRWKGKYMVHRYIGREGDFFCFMGDGNLIQVEKVEEKDVLGILQTIYHPDGTEQDCRDSRWLRKGALWYRFRRFRRFILPLYRKIILSCFLLAMVACSPVSEPSEEIKFVNETMLPHTSVRSQGRTGACWAYTMSSLVESEVLRNKKDTVRLSVMYPVREKYMKHFEHHYYSKGRDEISSGGLGHTFLNLWKEIGAVPNKVFTGLKEGNKVHDHRQLMSELKKLAKKAVKEKNLAYYKEKAEKLLDETLGEVPDTFIYKGIAYTPQSFADSIGFNAEDYMEITSFTHHPFYQEFALEVPDNWEHATSYNLPIDTLETIVRNSLLQRRTIGWNGDVSEEGFNYRNGIAVYPSSPVSQEERQKGFECFETTDDHMMHIIGSAFDESGKFYYVLKNSWGKQGPYQGLIYMSEDYFRVKTVSVIVHKRWIEAYY